jgi:hypothetical protein
MKTRRTSEKKLDEAWWEWQHQWLKDGTWDLLFR